MQIPTPAREGAIAPARSYSLDEYFALEEQAEFRSEYHAGAIIPMTGASFNHNRLSRNLLVLWVQALQGKNYEPFSGDVKVWIPQYQKVVYPDVMLVKDEPSPYGNRTDTLTNPCVVVEILSKSTAAYDRSDKFKLYRAIASLEEYLLVDQYEVEVQQYSKRQDGFWLYRVYNATEDVIRLESVGIEMSVGEIYKGIAQG